MIATAMTPVWNLSSAPECNEPEDFTWWCAMVAEPNREQWSADWFRRNVSVFPYWPTFVKQMRKRGRGHAHEHRPKLSAVVPGLLFAPEKMMRIGRRDEVFDQARIHGFMPTTGGGPARIARGDIEIIRRIEAKLNLPPERKGVLFQIGEKVRFVNELYGAFLGDATIFEIASEGRIGVEVQQLFGRVGKIYVAASEIEAM